MGVWDGPITEDPTKPKPQKSKAARYIRLGCGLFAALFAGIVVYPILVKAIESTRRVECQKNEIQIGMAISLYSADNDMRLPNASNWATAIQGYLGPKGYTSEYRCPDGKGTNFTCAFNTADSTTKLADYSDLDDAVVIFESDSPNMNASGGKRNADLYRHGRGCNLVSVDSHVDYYIDDEEMTGTGRSPIWTGPDIHRKSK